MQQAHLGAINLQNKSNEIHLDEDCSQSPPISQATVKLPTTTPPTQS